MNKYIGMVLGISAMLLSVSPALADADVHGDLHSNEGLHLGSVVSAIASDGHANANANLGAGADVKTNIHLDADTNVGGDDGDGIMAHVQTAVAGVINSITGSSFTLSPAKTNTGATGTVTVATNGSTTFRGNGATSTGSLKTGETVFVVGTTANASNPMSITATLVVAFKQGVNFFAHLLGI